MSSLEPSRLAGELPDERFVVAEELFGDLLEAAERYARMLATDGVVRGLIGPREAPRIWDRHLLNCAVVQEAIPAGAYVADVGSGAGLPGIPLALARPDLSIALIEPLLRRSVFLDKVVSELALGDRVEVLRGRAEELISMFHVKQADVATARAVASLDRLARWSLPLVRVGGRMLAMKGSTAAEEVAEHRAAIAMLGGGEPAIVRCGQSLLDEPATLVEVVKRAIVSGTKTARPGGKHGARDGKASRSRA